MEKIQQITINVGPGVPNTGLSPASSVASEPFSATGIYLVFGALVVLAGVALLVRKTGLRKIVKERFSLFAVVGVCLVTSFAIAVTSGAVAMPEDVEPTIALSPDSLEYSLQPGGSGHFEFDATVTTDTGSSGYKMFAASSNANSGISLAISDKGSQDKIAIPSVGNEPVVFRELNENAAAGHTAGHAVHVALDDSVEPGSYTIDITYTLLTLTPPELPTGANPPNVSGTNPATPDVYPTTGWGGDTVAITSKASFVDVSTVTIGGTPCESYNVVTSSLIACKLPSKVAGTSNEIVVTDIVGQNLTPASTYNHMKVTYFDPSLTTVNIGGANYAFYPNGFTSSDCSAMTPSNDPIDSTPAASMVYVRDTRNKQTYKIKKMADNKCWMVDNLKYIDTEIVNAADGTKGMVFNNGDHLGNGIAYANNTVDETDMQSSTNSDKAFYNNPMSHSYCYGTENMPINTLTHCGYQYNWYAATNGAGTYAESLIGTNVTGSICPVNFRLPSGTSDGNTATGNGTNYNTADFAVLNTSMNAGTLVVGTNTSTYYAGWMPTGAWGGTFSGHWGGWGFSNMTARGYYWSSTVNTDSSSHYLYYRHNVSVEPGNMSAFRTYGLPVRCVME